MFALFAHSMHDMEVSGEMTHFDYTPFLIAATVLIVILFGVIVYLSVMWEPKKAKKADKKPEKS